MSGAIGHNQPPSQIEFTRETCEALGEWLKENPVVETEEQARSGKLLVDRAANCLKDLEAERNGQVRPLNEEVKRINDHYRTPRNNLEAICNQIKERLLDFIKAEEARRQAILEEKRRQAEEAERRAREAEERERETKEDAKVGVLDSDVAGATIEADAAFAAFTRSERELARAERDTHVKIGGGFNRALSARQKETLIVDDPAAALVEMGFNSDIIEAICKAARAYRKLHGRLPNGIKSDIDRSI